ncbi:retrotransposon-related protein [Tanacetum coccineum]
MKTLRTLVILALRKWRGYLLDSHFVIKTDHVSLKYLLDQRITTPTQMKWIPKPMGFDYEVIYKKGSENRAGNALSSLEDNGELLSLTKSTISTEFYKRIVDSWDDDLQVKEITNGLQNGTSPKKHYT